MKCPQCNKLHNGKFPTCLNCYIKNKNKTRSFIQNKSFNNLPNKAPWKIIGNKGYKAFFGTRNEALSDLNYRRSNDPFQQFELQRN